MGEGDTVLVTGGSGFIGVWCIIGLLRRGYAVRTTVRDLKRSDEVRAMVASEIDPGNRLALFAADLMRDGGWSEAVDGCTHVLHVASPFPPAQPRNADDLIVPARDGALRVLRASVAAGVKRVVMTSSTAAVGYGREPRPALLTEEHWTNPAHPDASPYVQSKTLAERAAWDFMRTQGGAMALAVVNPAAVLGPVLGRDFSYSVQIVERLMKGDLPGSPRLGFPMVDVRDIADLHIAAMTAPEAAGQRFIGAGPFLWIADVARVLKDRLGPAARKVPSRVLPSWLVRIVALVDGRLQPVIHELDRRRDFSADKAERLLGWKQRPVEDSIVDCAQSLIRHGVVRGV
jgi:nucleoside-diphosphate-sugar epimerase